MSIAHQIDTTVPEFDQKEQNSAALEWLDQPRGIASVVIVTRPDRDAAERLATLEVGDEAVPQTMRETTFRAIAKIQEASGSRYNDINPSTYLIDLLVDIDSSKNGYRL